MFGSPNDTNNNTTKKRKVIFPNNNNNNNNNANANNDDVNNNNNNTTTTINNTNNRFVGVGSTGYYYNSGGFSPPTTTTGGNSGTTSGSIGSSLSFSPTTTGGNDSSNYSSSSSALLFRRSVVGRRPTTTTNSTTTTATIRRNNNDNSTDDNNDDITTTTITTKFYNLCNVYRTRRMKELNEILYRRMESLQSQVPSNPIERYIFLTSSTNNDKENADDNDDDNYNIREPISLYHNVATDYLRNVYTINKLYYCVVPALVETGKLGGEIIAMGHDDGNQCGYPIKKEKEKETNNKKKKVSSGNDNDDDDDDDDDDDQEERTVPPFVQTKFPSLSIQTSFKGITAGGMHSVAVTVDGTVYSWGSADDGALGRLSISERTGIYTNNTTIALESEPGLVTRFITKDGINEEGTIIQVAAGDMHILFLSIAGNVYQCGTYKDCDSGKFCIPNPRQLTKDEIEDERRDGGSEQGKKKHPIEGYNKRPVHIASMPGPVQQIFTRGALNAALLFDGTVVTWGFGCKGELARTATMDPLPIFDTTTNNYDLGKLYMYDFSNPEREQPKYDMILNNFLTPKPVLWNDTSIRPKKEILHVACGSYHLLVTARDRNDPTNRSYVYSAGINNYGQLGHGDLYVDRHELTIINSLINKDIVQVAAGEHHSLVLDSTGTAVYAFGRSDYGQLGIGKQSTGSSQPTPQYVQFPPINNAKTDNNNNNNSKKENKSSQDDNDDVPIYPIITQIEAGERHSLAITVDHQIYTWGFNETAPTGHYPNTPDQDINRPTILNLNKYIGTDRTPYCQVYMASGGGQHSLLLCKRYSAAATTSNTSAATTKK